MTKEQKRIFTVVFKRGEMSVVAANVLRETPQFYSIERPEKPDHYAFGFSKRIPKARYATTPSGALASYLIRRREDLENHADVVQQATEQIQQAETLLATYEPARAADAVAGDPQVRTT